MSGSDGVHLLPDIEAGTWGVACTRHGLYREGLAQQHAVNLEAKHRREYHDNPWPDLSLTAVVPLVCFAASLTPDDEDSQAAAVLDMWKLLTGLPYAEAVALAQRIQASREPVTAAVIPF